MRSRTSGQHVGRRGRRLLLEGRVEPDRDVEIRVLRHAPATCGTRLRVLERAELVEVERQLVVPRSPVAAVHASTKRSTPSTSPFTPGTAAPAARSAATSSSVASSGTTASSSSNGGVRKTAPRTSPPSSNQPNSIASSDHR